MSVISTIKKSPLPLEKLLRPQSKLDLIFDIDLINDFIDVRSAAVLELCPNHILLTQTDPPVLKSMVGRPMEATFVGRDPISSDILRWGWHGQVVDFVRDYRLNEQSDETIQAVAISYPTSGNLTETNARMDYRLSIGMGKKITIQTHPSFGRATLFDFSAGGVLIGIPTPPQAKVGMRLWFTLFLPFQSDSGQQTTINGEAEVVRVVYEPGDPQAKIGLRFMDLDLNSTRTLQKAINFYMLEEQRSRSRLA
ncbi:MAG: PilZ domain-containing protein [Candidatus Adiutrix sp.]